MDAIKVMNMKEKQAVDGQKEAPLYELADFNKTMALWRTIPYHTDTKINDEFQVKLKDAGHILGSSMYEFTFKGKKIVFTGDSGNSPAPLLKDTEKITEADYLVVDSVYGDRNHEDKDIRDEKFRRIVMETIEKKGALVIPAFSVERTQVVLYELNNLVEEKKIPSVPVFLDSPLGNKVTDIYKNYTTDFNSDVKKEISGGDNIFNFPKLTIVHGREESDDIVKTPNPKIIIAGSGMSSGGRVVGHEMHFLPDPNSTILLMGYQAIGTLGREIQNKPSEIEINGSLIPVKARIEMISGYSSHKDSDGIVNMVSDVAEKVKRVFVVMGEPKSSTFLVQRLRDELEVDAIYPERGIIYRLDV
jgi:metallo-beta-lactamase family protein